MDEWLPIEDGSIVPNGAPVRPNGEGGFEFNPDIDGDGLADCEDPIAHFRNGELVWECRTKECTTTCEADKDYNDPTNPEQFIIRCLCQAP